MKIRLLTRIRKDWNIYYSGKYDTATPYQAFSKRGAAVTAPTLRLLLFQILKHYWFGKKLTEKNSLKFQENHCRKHRQPKTDVLRTLIL